MHELGSARKRANEAWGMNDSKDSKRGSRRFFPSGGIKVPERALVKLPIVGEVTVSMDPTNGLQFRRELKDKGSTDEK